MKKISILVIVFLVCALSASAVRVKVNDFDPKPAEAGEYLNVWFKISNDGNKPVADAWIEVAPKDGLRLSNGEPARKEIGIINGKGSDIEQFRFLVTDIAIEGPNAIEVTVGHGQIQSTEDVYIEVIEKDLEEVILSVGTIDSDPTRIKPQDDNVRLALTLQNLGDANAVGVKARLSGLPDGVTFTDSYSDLALPGTVEADGSSEALFYIDVDKDVKPGEYTLALTTDYKYKPDPTEDDYELESAKLPVRLTIRSIPLYEITDVAFDPPVLAAGMKKVKMKLSLKNIGEEEGESVRVRAYAKTEQPFVFDVTSDFVSPKLEPGETGEATLEFDLDDTANLQKYFLDLEIKNTVADDVIIYDDKVAITVINPKEDKSFVYAGAVGIVALIAFIWIALSYAWKYAKKRKLAATPKNHYKKSYLKQMKK